MSAKPLGAGAAARPRPRPILRAGTWLAVPIARRATVVGGVLALALLAASLLTLTLGSLGIPLGQLAASIAHPDARAAFILNVYRGPRLVTAIGVGAAFGVAGALFQTVTRNPLGSPDVIGLSSGASAGAATFGLLLPGILPLPVGALLGSLAAIALVYFGTGRGFTSPSRMILVGIGVAAMALAYVQFVITAVSSQDAVVLGAYISGTLADRSWGDVAVVWITIAVLGPCALALARRLDLIEMGDELADALGGRSSRTRTLVVLTALGLSTAAVAAAGPISFVALTAPQVARRLARTPGASVTLSALMGAFMMVLADLLVQQSPFGSQLPVGLLTACIGGLYLGYLLVREWKKGTV
ncbi:FecCD family ABC transporter permease [Frondihabitans australicus]|uniref:Iron complex transport system permease protein n=1 Tax=Frondihabitans australicus TaxID=386892 RepID=A0A495ICU4_9MICO|nr:iron chelate uptake ABC transporter family permease subunit [Frondihabitans australicus]RKR73772.1 iron complex transport system permease protein [Frondihabitans australicus]